MSSSIPSPYDLNRANYLIEDVSVIMPIGGLATRALEVTRDEIPKHLIELSEGYTVLDNITAGLQAEGFRKFVFCTGHHSQSITDYLGRDTWQTAPDTSYAVSHEREPLGPDGAVLQAIETVGVAGNALILPGDLVLPWAQLGKMCAWRNQTGSDITLALTSFITERTTDVGKLVVNRESMRLEECYARNQAVPESKADQRALTSAAAIAIDAGRYVTICNDYVDATDQSGPLSMRDNILPWAIRQPEYAITAFDIEGEILDLGTPDNIRFGQTIGLKNNGRQS